MDDLKSILRIVNRDLDEISSLEEDVILTELVHREDNRDC